MPTIKGKWKWNEILSPDFYGLSSSVGVDFVSNGTDYWSITFHTTPRVNIAYDDTNDSTDYAASVEGTSLVCMDEYRIMDFGDVEQSVSQYFYDYLVANAKPEGEWDDEEPPEEEDPEEPPVVVPPASGSIAEKLQLIAENLPKVYAALKSGGLPTITTEDNGKIIEVADGAYVLKSLEESSVKTYIDEYISSALGGDY